MELYLLACSAAYLAGVASCFAVLYVLGRRSRRTGPNSKVITHETVVAVLTKHVSPGAP